MCVTWGYLSILAVIIIQRSCMLPTQLPKPINAVSLTGNRVKLECINTHSLFPVDWKFAEAGSTSFSYIYTAERITENVSSRYKIDTDNKARYDIVIDCVDSDHAGTYKCTPIAEDFNATSNSAGLVVLASDPVCNTNSSFVEGGMVEGEYIEMWCAVNYTGDWIPVMNWARNNAQIVDVNIVYTNSATTVKSSLTQQLNSRDNGATFTCRTSFNSTSTKFGIQNVTLKSDESFASNIPQYQHLWNFSAIVLYAPRNLTIKPKKGVYEAGERILCWANGNPAPAYEWMDIETNRTIPGSDLNINDYLRQEKNHDFRCTAYNTVAGVRKQINETISITVAGVSQIPTEQSVVISIIAFGTVCCLVLTLYLCHNRCTYKTDIAEALEDYSAERPGLRPVQAGHPSVFQDDASRSVAESTTGYLPKEKDFPIYTDVTKNRDWLKHPDSPGQSAQATAPQYRPSPSKTHHGADGTQYMDVTSMRDLNATAPTRYPPMFSLVETYASIDHTTDAPPPLLPPKRQ